MAHGRSRKSSFAEDEYEEDIEKFVFEIAFEVANKGKLSLSLCPSKVNVGLTPPFLLLTSIYTVP